MRSSRVSGARGVFCRLVKVDVASHSPQVDELREDLLSALAGMETREGDIPFLLNGLCRGRRGGELDRTTGCATCGILGSFYDACACCSQRSSTPRGENPHPILVPPVRSPRLGR